MIGRLLQEATMRLGMLLKYSGAPGSLALDEVLEAERLGYDSVWSGEAYGTDAVTPCAWILARTTRIRAGAGIMQMSARTPACTAMTALTLQALSNNRFLLGIGASGPLVVEGWHGVAFGKPLARTREYIEILRKILKRDAPLQHEGELYQIPYRGPGSTGLGKPLKSILHGDPDMPIYTASITPAGLRTAGEVADGILPIFMSPEKPGSVTGPLSDGIRRRSNGGSLADVDIAPYVRINMGADLQACRDALKPEFALYIGGMGARSKNFYNEVAKQLGYEEAAAKIQDAYLGGRRSEAIAAVPDALVDETSLVGNPERIRDRLQAWKEAGKRHEVGSMLLSGVTRESLRVVAEAVL
jgi:F420-dependent oxidoreductase-like protein